MGPCFGVLLLLVFSSNAPIRAITHAQAGTRERLTKKGGEGGR